MGHARGRIRPGHRVSRSKDVHVDETIVAPCQPCTTAGSLSNWPLAQLRAELVVSGLAQPVAFVQDPSQSNVQVVAQQGGRIRVVRDGELLEQDFLDLTPEVWFAGERGLLGFAFASDYATSGRVYVSFSNLAGHTVIARFLRDAVLSAARRSRDALRSRVA